MDFFNIVVIVAGIGNLLLGCLVFSRGEKNKVTFSLGIYAIISGVWSLALYLYQLQFIFSGLIWIKVVYCVASAMVFSLFYFTLAFTRQNRYYVIISSLLFLLFSLPLFYILFFTKLWVAAVITRSWGPDTILGPAYIALCAFWTFFLVLAIYHLMIKYFASAGITRERVKYILVGVAFFVVIVVTADAIIPILFNNTQYFRTSPLSALFFVAFTSYAILRYDLLDIGLVLADMMVGIMGIILAVLPFLMPTLVLKIFTSFVFFLFCFIGYYLIRANKEESRNREDAEKIIIRERALRKEAEQLAVNLQRLDKAKTQFMLSTQHHLRSPLTVIQGYLSLIEEGTYGKINKEVASRIHVSLGEAQKLIKVVNDLLDMAKYQMNVNKTECQSGDVVSILRDVLADLAATARRKNLSLEYAEQTMLPPVVVNAKGIQEAIYNIVDNAIKYTSQGGVTVRAKVAGKNVLISIADTGIGMEEVDRIGLFKRTFERGDQTKGINTTGKGIGLYLAGQMILNSGGNIWVMSKGRGFGTTFYIELPVANPALVANPVINAKNNPEIAMSVK